MPASTGKRRSIIIVPVIVGAGLVALLIWLLLRGCGAPAAPPSFRFDYIRVKAEELGRDPDRIKAFVADELRTLDYRGQRKGPLGCLWDGGGSAEEKEDLQQALLACTDPQLESPDLSSALNSSDALKVEVQLRVYRDAGQLKPETAAATTQPVSALLGDVHSVEFPAENRVRVTLRPYGTAPVLLEADTAGATGVGVAFLFEGRVVERELWCAANRVGLRRGRATDRHDFALLPARVGKHVREKEELRLKEAGRDQAPEARGYLALLDYCLFVDDILAGIEKDLSVRAQFDQPRILFWSRFQLPRELGQGVSEALDLRWNHVRFTGEPAAALQAAEIRDFNEAGFEQQFLARYLKRPVQSTFQVFSSIREDYPDSFDRRLALALAALADLQQGDSAFFRGRAGDTPGPEVSVQRASEGFSLRCGALNPELVAGLAAAEGPRLPDAAGGEATFPGAPEAAAALEAALAASATGPALPQDFVLETRIERAGRSIVVPGARFEFRWGTGEDQTEQRIEVASVTAGLRLKWMVHAGLRPVRGERSVSAEALEDSAAHNPWYRPGEAAVQSATSFVVSRRVFAELKAGRSAPFQLQGRYPAGAEEGDPRPVEWSGELRPVGSGEIEVSVNNRREKLAVLYAEADGRRIALLDDPRFPVGMADALTALHTAVTVQVVDRDGVPVAGAALSLEGGRYESSADGRLELPPGRFAYEKLKAGVSLRDEPLGEHELDLRAPGLQPVLLQVERPVTRVLWIKPGEEERLAPLNLSDQVKRHALRDLAAGRCIAIPSRMVGAWPRKTCAYFAYEVKIGYVVGVMESGLNAAEPVVSDQLLEEWLDAAEDKYQDAMGAQATMDRTAVIHAFRGALVAWWVYGAYRVGGLSHEEAIIQMLQDARYWMERTDLFKQAEGALGGALNDELAAEKLVGLLKGAASSAINLGRDSNDVADQAFILTYVASSLYLAGKLAGS